MTSASMAGCGGASRRISPRSRGAEIADTRRLGAIVAEQVLDGIGGQAELEAALAERGEIGGLAAG